MGTFSQFYEVFGLTKYPFSVFSTEDEVEISKRLFTQPTSFSIMRDNFLSGQTIIMSGNRGIGKTAVLYNLVHSTDCNTLACIIDDYSSIPVSPTIVSYYESISTNVVNALFSQIIGKEKYFRSLSKDDRLYMSWLYDKYATPHTKAQLINAIGSIQLNPIKRMINRLSGLITLTLNFGITIAVKLCNDIIATKLGIITISDDKIKEIVPRVGFQIDDQFISAETSYTSLCKILNLLKKFGFNKAIVFLDKIDEDNRFTNDAEIVAAFITPLLTDNKVLLNKGIQLFISIWSIPFSIIKDQVRTQKYYCPELAWQDSDLIAIFNQRMVVYSGSTCREWNSVFAPDVTENDKMYILKLANGNPRDLWHLMDRLFIAQYEIDSGSEYITNDAIQRGQIEFVRKFNYFEYYPRKKRAKKSSMDIYKYINHLLKLTSNEFTTNQFNEEAQTGSSTPNYITGMQNIGLVRRTDATRNGGCVYEIIDPKVVFAREHRIKIESI